MAQKCVLARLMGSVSLILTLGFGFVSGSLAEEVKVLIQSSPLAGSQYYALKKKTLEIQIGDTLTLVREPNNRHDARAIRVEWQGEKLGYVPRLENEALARVMDRGEQVDGRVTALMAHPDPWQRLRFDVYLKF